MPGTGRAPPDCMSIIGLLVMLVVIGVVWYLVTTYIPMAAPIKTVITVIAVLALCIFLLNYFGLLGGGWSGPHRWHG